VQDTPWRQLDGWLWGRLAQGEGLAARALRQLRYPYAVIRDLALGDVNLRAMGLVYNTLLALIPLLAFSFAVLKVFGAQRDLEPLLLEFFRPVGEAAPQLTARVMSFVNGVSSGLVGSVGFALLLWTLMGTIQKVEDSFNYLWRVEKPRTLGRRIAEYLVLVIVGPMLLVLAFGLGIAPPLMITALFIALYRFVPNTSVRWLPAIGGGLVAGALWWMVAQVFADLYTHARSITIVYAGFALIIAALVWTWAGWLILLIGVQVSFYLQNPAYLRLGLVELRLSAAETEDIALRLMLLVGRSHVQGARRWRNEGLARALRVPGIAVAQVTGILEQAGLLAADEHDAWLPGRDIDHITLQELLRVVRNPRSTLVDHDAAKPLPAVDALRAELQRASDEALQGRTLGSWVAANPE
jgi:membrane protein